MNKITYNDGITEEMLDHQRMRHEYRKVHDRDQKIKKIMALGKLPSTRLKSQATRNLEKEYAPKEKAPTPIRNDQTTNYTG